MIKHICGHPYVPSYFRMYLEVEQALAPTIACIDCIPEAERPEAKRQQRQAASILFQEASMRAGYPALRGRMRRWEGEYIRGQHLMFLQLTKADVQLLPDPDPELFDLINQFERRFHEWTRVGQWLKNAENMHLVNYNVASAEARVRDHTIQLMLSCRVCDRATWGTLQRGRAYQVLSETCKHSFHIWGNRRKPPPSDLRFCLVPEHIWVIRSEIRKPTALPDLRRPALIQEQLKKWEPIVMEPGSESQ